MDEQAFAALVNQFRRQVNTLLPGGPFLLLDALNEAHKKPSNVKSPHQVLEEQQGTALEISLLLVSVLLGCGYNCFVAQGLADSALVSADTSEVKCPYEPRLQKEETTEVKRDTSKYSVERPPELRSKYVSEGKQKIGETIVEASERIRSQDEEYKGYSEGKSLHFWVLVLPPNREVTSPIILEVTTGDRISNFCKNSPKYYCIHGIFNHQNYWACRTPQNALRSDMFRLSDSSSWFSLISNSNNEGSCDIRIPNQWSQPLTISQKVINRQFPGGWRQESYKDAIVHRYAPFEHPRGAVLQVWRKDAFEECRPPDQWVIFEMFNHRADSLLSRIISGEGKCVDEFKKNRKDTLKAHHYCNFSQVEVPEEAKKQFSPFLKTDSTEKQKDEHFEFYSEFRVDGLKSRKIESDEGMMNWIETFHNRNDALFRRTIYFDDIDSPGNVMTLEEEYEIPSDKPPHLAIQKKIFDMQEGKIKLVYHFGPNRLLQATRTFEVPPNGNPTFLTSEMTRSFQPDDCITEPSIQELWALLGEQMKCQKSSSAEVQKGIEETLELRQNLETEEKETSLLPGLFQLERNPRVQEIMQKKILKEAMKEEDRRRRKEEKEGKVDIVVPYLALVKGAPDVDLVTDTFLGDLKTRLALRANLLQDRVDKAKAFVQQLRDEAINPKKRLTADERSALAERTAHAEATHRRLKACLSNWKVEASARYEELRLHVLQDHRIVELYSAKEDEDKERRESCVGDPNVKDAP